jgi:ADP-ribose pyrophosphatase
MAVAARDLYSPAEMIPKLPGHRLTIVRDERPPSEARGFVYVRRLEMVATFANGETSPKFNYDAVERSRLDAVVVLAHFDGPDGRPQVVLRSSLRPPVFARPMEARPIAEKESLGELWEVPAGLVEADETTPAGLLGCAARELLEETGLTVDPTRLVPLGPPTFPTAGVIGERHFFYRVEVDPTSRVTPPEDGSVLEREAKVIFVPLHDALEACRSGEIEDAKTELGLRRLAEVLRS